MAHQNPSIAVDLALVTVSKGALCCVLKRRPDAGEVGGEWAMPGGFVHIDESVDETALRVLQTKVGMETAYLEQLYTYGGCARDPRGRVISVTHFALYPSLNLDEGALARDLTLAQIKVDWDGEQGGQASAWIDDTQCSLAFDHADILGDLVKRLRGKIDYTNIALELLPHEFTLRQAQEVYEAILGRTLTKPAFRRKLLDRGTIIPTGKRETASAFRPAELYVRK